MQLDPGTVIKGRVTRVTDFGAFIQFENGETGLVHISQLAHSFVKNIHDHIREGDSLEVKILGRDEKGRLDLSVKDLSDDEEPKPKTIGRQNPQFESKLRSFMKDAKERNDSSISKPNKKRKKTK